MSWLADTIRIICWPLGVITLAICAGVALRSRKYLDRAQQFRFLALAALSLAVAFGEFESLGRPVRSWPTLIFNLIGLVLALAGSLPVAWRMRKGHSSSGL